MQLPQMRLLTFQEADLPLGEQAKKKEKNQVLSGRQAVCKDRSSVAGKKF